MDPKPPNFQSFQVDVNNPKDLKQLITRLQKRRKLVLTQLGFSGISFQSSKVNVASVLPELERMLDTDLSSIYPSEGTRIFYVYAHCDPTKKLDIHNNLKHLLLASRFKLKYVPFYIGKGVGSRAEEMNRNDSHRKIRTRILGMDKEVEVVRLVENLTEGDALALEAKLVDILGIRSFGAEGILVNLDEGEKSLYRRRFYSDKARVILRRNGFYVPIEKPISAGTYD